MYYIVGDIHGQYGKLESLFNYLLQKIRPDDVIIFIGDYLDRGPSSYAVIEFLIDISRKFKTVFIMGNHEKMFLDYYETGQNYELYIRNGGISTIKSYIAECGSLKLPEKHVIFFNNLVHYYEEDDFIAVHAGLNPDTDSLDKQENFDLMWIRENFFLADKKWGKTVIFGHTPTPILNGTDNVYFDEERNIIGIDTYAMSEGYPLSCLRWPDKKIFQSYGI